MILLLSALAFGEVPDLPPKPSKEIAPLWECESSISLKYKHEAPDGLLDQNGEFTCSGVLVPTSQIGHLLKIEAWADSNVKLYQAETEFLVLQNSRLSAEIRHMKEEKAKTVLITSGVVALSIAATYGVMRAVQ